MDITEFEALTPTRVDAVASPANGIGFLMLKSVDPEEVAKAFVGGLCGTAGCDVCKERFTGLTADQVEKARMKAKERHDLEESEFAFPKQRKEPINDAAHVRAAMSRFDQVEGVTEEEKHEAARRIMARAKHFGIEVSEDSDVAHAAKAKYSPTPSLAQTREHVEGETGPVHMDNAQDEGKPPAKPYRQPTPPVSNGEGTTAPDKSVPKAEALSQTHDLTKEEIVALYTEHVEKKGKGSADSDPGSPAWEHKDVALGEKAEALVSQLMEVVRTFTEREKAEGDGAEKAAMPEEAEGAIRQFVRGLVVPPTNSTTKEITMTHDELIKLLDERDEARRKAEKKAAKKAERKAEKAAAREAEAAKAAEEAAKAAEGDTQATKSLEERLAALEAQPAPRPMLNEAAIKAALSGEGEPGDLFKALEDRAMKQETPFRRQEAGLQYLRAKMVAQEGARAGVPQGAGVPIIRQHPVTTDPGPRR